MFKPSFLNAVALPAIADIIICADSSSVFPVPAAICATPGMTCLISFHFIPYCASTFVAPRVSDTARPILLLKLLTQSLTSLPANAPDVD